MRLGEERSLKAYSPPYRYLLRALPPHFAQPGPDINPGGASGAGCIADGSRGCLEDSGKQAKDLVRQEARARREDVTSTMPMLMRAIETRWLHEMQVLPGARHRHVEEPAL